MGINIIGEDDDDIERPKKRREIPVKRIQPIQSSISPVIPVVLIMGAILLGGMWFIQDSCPELQPCPNITCPNITIPACPEVICEKDEYICNPTFELDDIECEGYDTVTDCIDYVNELDQNVSITFINSLNYSKNVTYYMTLEDYGMYETTELNLTDISEEIGGNLTLITTEVE